MKISADRLNRILNDADAAFSRLRELHATLRATRAEKAALEGRFRRENHKLDDDPRAVAERLRLISEIAGLELDVTHAEGEANRAGKVRDNAVQLAERFRDQLPTSFRQRIAL